MCGFCGTIYRFPKNTIKFNYQKINNNLKKLSLKKLNIQNLIDLVKHLKSDEYFFEYFNKNKNALSLKKNICKFILLKINQVDLEGKALLKNCLFFLEVELDDTVSFIKKNTKKINQKNFSNIIFLKVLYSLILSINYLEIRGRDSLGLILKMNIKEKNYTKKYRSNKSQLIKIKKLKNQINGLFVFKTFNEIGYLGENSKKIIDKLFSQQIFLDFLNSDILNFTIVMHTRWASVGKINFDNTHPLFLNKQSTPEEFISVNGDIFNYQKFVDKKYKEYTDAYALNFILRDVKNIFDDSTIDNLRKLDGSFSFNLVSSDVDNSFIIGKKGLQGLYFGESFNNRFYFASDLYGLVFDSSRYLKIDSDSIFKINTDNTYDVFDFSNHKYFESKKFYYENISISLRDIHKKNFETFLEKEINETSEVLNKTLENYLTKRNILNFKDINIKNIVKKILNQSINEIIITGMGTCYTASVVISSIFRDNLTYFNKKLNIRPHLASEASAFYLSSNMSKTLVIAIAQSGTTIDTNTYVNMAKLRNANVISFINKRDGDLSKIVHGNLFIGDGRDVEIAVPSTKTYSAHIFLGFLFTYYVKQEAKTNPKQFDKDIAAIKEIPYNLNKSWKNILGSLSKIDYSLFAKIKEWYVVYDNDFLATTNQEIKIKLSELCYHSIPNYHVDDFIRTNKKNSILVLNTSKIIEEIKEKLSLILSRNNYIFLISNDPVLKRYKPNKLIPIHYESKDDLNSLFTSIVIFQIFAKNAAKFLGSRAKKLNFPVNYKALLKSYDEGLFTQGNFGREIKNIISYKNKKETQKNKIISLGRKIYRPIDTIKHQAKTITVGTLRDQFNYDKYFAPRKSKDTKIKIFYLYSEFTHETHMYFLVNLLNSFYKNKKPRYLFQFARNYEYQRYHKFTNFINLIQNLEDFKNEDYSSNNFLINIKNIFNQLNKNAFKVNNYFNNHIHKINKNFSNIKFFGSDFGNFINTQRTLKILGSGVNYNAAKILSLNLNKKLNKTFSFDILENHKHIDISAESKLIILLGNIKNDSYHKDAHTEILKFLAHKNDCFILVDHDNVKFYDKILNSKFKICVHKTINEDFSFIFYLLLFERYLK